jgi:hypothetical protein
MLSEVLSIALVATLVSGGQFQRRDPATNDVDFTAAANALISSYIPSADWPTLTASFGAAASSASVSGDVGSLITSALEASTRPSWFQNAIPTQFSNNIMTLESAIDAIRPTSAPVAPVPTVITTTSTDSAGHTVTSTFSTNLLATTTTVAVYVYSSISILLLPSPLT